MAITEKAELKTYFETGDTPTQEEFEALIDGIGGTVQGRSGTYDIQAANEGGTGSARGEHSVDLQTSREGATQVAAGVGSVLIGGHENGIADTGTGSAIIGGQKNYDCTGAYNLIAGESNHNNAGNHNIIAGGGVLIDEYYPYYLDLGNDANIGNANAIFGQNNKFNAGNHNLIAGYGNFSNSGALNLIVGENHEYNSGHNCLIAGYSNKDNSGSHSVITGSYASNNTFSMARVHGGGVDARIIDIVARTTTSNNTPKAITIGDSEEGAIGSIIINPYSAWAFVIHIVAIDNTYANVKKMSFDGVISYNEMDLTVVSNTLGTDATIGTLGVSAAITTDATNHALRIMATGLASTTILWTARVELTQVGQNN